MALQRRPRRPETLGKTRSILCAHMAGAEPSTTLHAGQLWMVSLVESTQNGIGAHGQHPMRHRPPQMSQVSRPALMLIDVEMVALLRAGRASGGAAAWRGEVTHRRARAQRSPHAPVRAHERPGRDPLGVVDLWADLGDHDGLLHHDRLHDYGLLLRDDHDLHGGEGGECSKGVGGGVGHAGIAVVHWRASELGVREESGQPPPQKQGRETHAPEARRRRPPPASPRRR